MEISEKLPHEAVAAEVRAYLGRQRRSGASVALELGWTQVYMSRRLTGAVAFDVNDLAAIAGVLDVPVTAFFEGPGVRIRGLCPRG
jgi:transcriptional regulator with XRE-family HTH domain